MEEIMNSLLFEAVRSEDLEAIQTLISEGADVNARDEYTNTPLFYVKNPETAEMLINKGAKVNIQNEYGMTPLFYVTIFDYLDITEMLINKGAKVNVKDGSEKTAFDYLKYSCKQEQAEKIKNLIRQKQQEEELEKLRQQEEELSNATEEMGQHNIGQGSCCIIC